MQGLDYIIPHSSDQPYDILQVIQAIVDERNFFEIMPSYAKNIIVGFAHMDGRSVGVVANQPNAKAGKGFSWIVFVLISFLSIFICKLTKSCQSSPYEQNYCLYRLTWSRFAHFFSDTVEMCGRVIGELLIFIYHKRLQFRWCNKLTVWRAASLSLLSLFCFAFKL